MFKIFGGITNVAFGLLALLFLSDSVGDYFGGNQEKVDELQSLIAHGVPIDVRLDEEWEETSISIKGIDVTVYQADYHFWVDSVEYEGRYTFGDHDMPDSDTITVYYLEEDPAINEANAEEALEEVLGKLNSNEDLWWGLAALVFSIVMLGWGVWNIKKGLRSLKGSDRKAM